MPDEWAKALRPTMALLGCTGTRIKLDTSWLVAMICLVLIPEIEIQIYVTGNRHITITSRGGVYRPVSPRPGDRRGGGWGGGGGGGTWGGAEALGGAGGGGGGGRARFVRQAKVLAVAMPPDRCGI